MPYATQQDLVDRYGATEIAQLTDPAAGAVIDPVLVARAIVDATAEIDGYLSIRYALPLPSSPQLLVRLCCDIARYMLFDVRAPEAVNDRYRAAVTTLRALASGAAKLGDMPAAPTAPGAVAVSVSGRDRLFGSDLMDQFGRL